MEVRTVNWKSLLQLLVLLAVAFALIAAASADYLPAVD
jgi:hypothetical protein